MELLQWYNLVFILPFVTAVGYLVLLATGSVAVGHGDVDADVDMDADIDHDVDHGIEHTVGHGYGDHEAGLAAKALSFLGFGRVPLSIILMSFCFIWGFTGWAANTVLGGILWFPILFFWPSLGVALVISVTLTSSLARGLSRIMPATETYAVSRRELVGKVATVRYPITAESGTATLHDHYGTFKEVQCRVNPDEPTIPEGSQVVLLRFDEEQEAFLIRQDPLGTLRHIPRTTSN